MKNQIIKLTMLALMPTTMLTFTSCSTPEGTETTAVVETKNGAMVVDTYTLTATVTAIDASKRTVTLATPDGKKNTFKAGTGVNLAQVQVGERITVQATEEIAVFLSKPGTPTSVGAGAEVALAARGHETAVLMAATREVTARITAIDTKHRKVTLQFVDGTKKTVVAGKQVNLANVKVGEDVTLQIGESLAIDVQKP